MTPLEKAAYEALRKVAVCAEAVLNATSHEEQENNMDALRIATREWIDIRETLE